MQAETSRSNRVDSGPEQFEKAETVKSVWYPGHGTGTREIKTCAMH